MKNKHFIKISLAFCLTVALLVSCLSGLSASAATTTKATKQLIADSDNFLSGIQMMESYAGSYGDDIGGSGLYWFDHQGSAFNEEYWKEFFANSKAMGYKICKFWGTYQMGGIAFDRTFNMSTHSVTSTDAFYVTGYTSDYITNLERIFQLAREQGIKICYTCMNHFEQAYDAYGAARRNYEYTRFSKFIYNNLNREYYIRNFLTGVAKLANRYSDVVVAMDLYCEPEADGGKWNTSRGTNWDNMRDFIKAERECINKYAPTVATYCSSTSTPDGLLGVDYGNLGLDFYAYDHYSSDGTFLNSNSQARYSPEYNFLDRPFIFGEVGLKSLKSGVTLKQFYTNYLNTCVEQKIPMAFYWLYKRHSNSSTELLETLDGRLREDTTAIREWHTNKYNLTTPSMMYCPISDNTVTVRWFGIKNADSYTVQRSTDKENWSNVTSAAYNGSACLDGNGKSGINRYEITDNTVEPGNTYYYRVVSGTAISDATYSVVVPAAAE